MTFSVVIITALISITNVNYVLLEYPVHWYKIIVTILTMMVYYQSPFQLWYSIIYGIYMPQVHREWASTNFELLMIQPASKQ